MNTTEVFRYAGKKFAVTFASVPVPGYVPSIYKDSKGNTKYRTSKQTRRSAVLCIIRQAYTGIPFTGIAIMSPKDRKSNLQEARRLALKRAIGAICNSVDIFDCGCNYCSNGNADGMWRAYRLDQLKKNDPAKWQSIVDKLSSIKEIKEAAAKQAKKNKVKKVADQVITNMQVSASAVAQAPVVNNYNVYATLPQAADPLDDMLDLIALKA
jgi:hypothetical protein